MTDLPKLWCLVNLPPPVHGASVINAQLVDSGVLRSRFEVRVFPLQFAKDVADLQRFGFLKVAKALAFAGRLLAALTKTKPDLAYFTIAPFGGAFYRDALFAMLLKLFKVEIVFHLHGKGIAAQLAHPMKRMLYRYVFHGTDVIHLSSLLTKDLGDLVPSSHVQVVPNGIDGVLPQDAAEIERARGERTRPPQILFLSNMVEEKGPLVVVEALGILKARELDFTAIFAGAAFSQECLYKFEAGIKALGLTGQVSYVGPAYGESKVSLMLESDMMAFPTYYPNECFPLVVLEAMKFGLPVVSTDEGAIAEIIEDGVTGFVIGRPDAGRLAMRLEELILDSARRRTLGRNGQDKFFRLYQKEHFEASVVAALERVLSKRYVV